MGAAPAPGAHSWRTYTHGPTLMLGVFGTHVPWSRKKHTARHPAPRAVSNAVAPAKGQTSATTAAVTAFGAGNKSPIVYASETDTLTGRDVASANWYCREQQSAHCHEKEEENTHIVAHTYTHARSLAHVHAHVQRSHAQHAPHAHLICTHHMHTDTQGRDSLNAGPSLTLAKSLGATLADCCPWPPCCTAHPERRWWTVLRRKQVALRGAAVRRARRPYQLTSTHKQ